MLPKILSEKTSMFRFFSSRFKVDPSKEKTARVVMWREFNILNSFTIEASFFSYIDSLRENIEFTPTIYEKMGCIIGRSLFEYIMIKEGDEKKKERKLLT